VYVVEILVQMVDGSVTHMLTHVSYTKTLPVKYRVRHRWVETDPPTDAGPIELPTDEWSDWDDLEPIE
jgi:hypothetical protein